MVAQLDPLVQAIDARVDNRIAAALAQAARPVFVNQRTVERVTGLPSDDYLEAARAGELSSFKKHRLVFVRTEEVVAFIEAARVAPKMVSDTTDSRAVAAARLGMRRIA